MSSETQRLEEVAEEFSTFEGFEGHLTDYGYRSIEPFFNGDSCLELGPADGHMTSRLFDSFKRIKAVDGSPRYAEMLTARYEDDDRIDIECALFEDFETDETFDTILAAHVIEHVADPIDVMQRARTWLAPGGVMIVQVPNSRSFHRLLGVKLGVLKSEDELSDRDHKIGHRRVYNADSLRADITTAGWVVEDLVGSYFKMFSNQQSEEWFDDKLVHAFYELGQDFPEHGTMIAAVCRLPN